MTIPQYDYKWSLSIEKKGLHVLVVDDDDIIRLILRDMIQSMGGVVFEAENGKKAIEHYETNEIDIILMDISMPVMNGFETIPVIKKMDCNCFIPIIAINAFNDETILAKALTCGADDFVPKPISSTVLIAKINAMMRFKEIYEKEHNHRMELFKMTEMLQKTNKTLTDVNQELEQYKQELEMRVAKQTEKIRQKDVQLIERDRMLSIGTLAAGMAHEINNPIGFIKASLVTLNKQVTTIFQSYDITVKKDQPSGSVQHLKERVEKIFQRISRGIDRVTSVVESLKRFSNIDLEDIRPLNINENLKETIHILKIKGTISQDLITTCLNTVPEINCSPREINQCLFNILNNALDAVEDKGSIHVASIYDKKLDTVIVQIIDTGIGMSCLYLNRAFDPFFTTKPIGHGTGVGLTLAERIVRNHKGRIELSSKKGEGTTVTIYFPIHGHMKIS